MERLRKKLIKYRAVKVIGKPILIEFSTKQGKKVFIKGIKGIEVPDPEKMETKELLKFLKDTGFTQLAKALQKVIARTNKTK